jgi:hypothetical protein
MLRPIFHIVRNAIAWPVVLLALGLFWTLIAVLWVASVIVRRNLVGVFLKQLEATP